MITTTRIEEDSLNRLRELAKSHRRSMTQELAVIIEAAPLTSYNPKSPTEVMAEMKPEDVPEDWLGTYGASNQELDKPLQPEINKLLKKQATYGDKPKSNFKKSKS